MKTELTTWMIEGRCHLALTEICVERFLAAETMQSRELIFKEIMAHLRASLTYSDLFKRNENLESYTQLRNEADPIIIPLITEKLWEELRVLGSILKDQLGKFISDLGIEVRKAALFWGIYQRVLLLEKFVNELNQEMNKGIGDSALDQFAESLIWSIRNSTEGVEDLLRKAVETNIMSPREGLVTNNNRAAVLKRLIGDKNKCKVEFAPILDADNPEQELAWLEERNGSIVQSTILAKNVWLYFIDDTLMKKAMNIRFESIREPIDFENWLIAVITRRAKYL